MQQPPGEPAASCRWHCPAARDRLYTALGAALFLAAVAAVACKDRFDLVVSDARGYYAYLPSLVIDGDLDFTNQMREHWDPDDPVALRQPRTATGLVRNKYPVGVALTLAPSFLAGHTVALAGHPFTGWPALAPNGYSLPYQLANLGWLLALVTWAVALTDRLLTGAFSVDPAVAAAALALGWLGTPLLYYTFREPFMAHAAGWFWVTATVYLVWRIDAGLAAGRAEAGRVALLAFTTSMALVCRPTNLFLAPFHLYLLGRVTRAGQLWALARVLPAAVIGLAPLAIQALSWRVLYGSWLKDNYAEEGVRWAEPALWQTLFSSRHGLFFWSPLLLLAMAGLADRFRRAPHPLAVCYLAGFAILWYFNSAWSCWWFGDAFGARAFMELTGLFVLGLAGALEVARRAGPAARRAFAGAVALALLVHFSLLGMYILHRIPRGEALLSGDAGATATAASPSRPGAASRTGWPAGIPGRSGTAGR